MASVITRSNHPDALFPGVKAWFGVEYNQFETIFDKIFDKTTGSLATERLAEGTGFGNAQVKTEGAAIAYDTDREGYVTPFTPVVFGLGYMVTREEVEDNQYKVLASGRAKALAWSMKNTVEQVHADYLLNAFNPAAPIGDGSSIISTSHTTLSGPQSNRPTVASDFSETALEDMTIRIYNAENSRGLKINLKPTKLIVSSSNMFNATRVMHSKLKTGSNFNDVNAINDMGILADGVIVSTYLNGDESWYVTTDAPVGLQSIWRREVELEKDNDFDTENYKAKATARFIPAIGDWRGVYGNPGA